MWISDIPAVITAGTTVKWRDESATVGFNESATSADYSLTYYLRTNIAGQGHISIGSAFATGWQFTISATDSGTFDAGDWYWCAIAEKSGEKYKLGEGYIKVKQSLVYSGTPLVFDSRTYAEKELDIVKAAILALETDKAKEYSIGDRTFKRIELSELIKRESQLKSIVATEQRASKIAQGLGDPKNLFIRFK